MPSAILSLPSRFSRPILSLLVLAASVLLLPFAERSSAQTFGGSNPIAVSGTVGASEGSTATVSGVSGTVTAISVTLTNLDITAPTSEPDGLNNVAMVLVPPSGSGLTPLDLFSGICGSGTEQVGNSTFTLADTGDTGTDNTSGMLPGLGISTCPSTLSGTYLPTDYFPAQDTFNSPGPGTNYNSAGTSPSTDGSGTFNFTRAFGLPTTGSGLNGTWTLYIATQAGTTYAGSPSLGSWTITFTTEAATATTTSLSTNNNGVNSNVFTNGNVGGQSTTGTQVTFTATVTANGNPVTAGTVTFYDSTGNTPGTGTVLASFVSVNGSGQASANVTFPASEEGSRTISAVFSGVSGTYASSTTPPGGEVTELTVNHPYNPSSTTFCNGPVAIKNSLGEPVGGTAGFPYPSQLVLGSGFSQLQGTIQSVTLTLNGLASEQPNFLGFLVEAPSGNALEAMSFADGSASTISSPVSLLLSDDGSGGLQSSTDNQESCTSGSPCKPADDYSQITPLFNDTFPAPAPSASLIGKPFPTGSSTFTSQFGGGSANGTWLLYLNNWLAENPPFGQVGSWCLNFTMQSNAHPTATSVSGSPNPGSFTPPSTTASVTLTANVAVTDASGLTVGAGSVTFVDGATTLGTSPVSNGQATLTTSLAEGTHQIVASYSGTDTGTEFGISTGAFDQRVDTATTKPTSATGAGPYTFCNTGSIVAPGLNNDSGPASPYPSNIFVTNLPGTVNAVTVTLNGFTTKDQGDLLSLLVGPGGNNLDFFSLTGSNVSTAPSPFNLTFADGGASISSENLSSSGTFAPTSFNTNIAYPQCPPNAPLCGTLGVGPPLASNPFTPTNKAATAGTAMLGNADAAGVFGGTTSSTYNGNGTWSLYLDDGGPTAGGEPINVNNGWCVSLTQNLPSISATPQSSSTFTQGGTGSFPVTITNEGAGPIGDPTATTANAMTITDVLPTGLTYSGFTGTDWSCSAGGQMVVCRNEDTVAAGATFNPLSINVNVSSTASGAIGNNTVSVSDAEAANTPAPSSGAVTIDVPPTITSASSTTFAAGAAGSFLVTTAAATFPTASLSEAGALPSGVMLTDNGNGTATLSGTPAAGTGGVYPITITAQNGISPNAAQSFILNVFPNITGISPNYGAPAAFIDLSGNFGATQGSGFVTVGGGVAEVTAWSNNAITIRVPSRGATGNVVVRASGATSNGVPFTFYPFPSITNVSAASGTPGTAVTFTGANLLDGGGNATVRFNGTPATISSDTSGSIQVTVPTGATSGRLLVEVNGVTLIALRNFTVYPTLPHITGVSPSYGAPAAFIDLSGNFGATQDSGLVTVGGGVAEVTAWSKNAITIRVPSSAATGNVIVRGSGAISNPVPFTFYPFPSITNVSAASGTPGTAVTITGTNLLDGGGNASVRFNGTPATISSDTGGKIQVTVPAGATSGRLLVEVNGVTLIAVGYFAVYPTLPNITGVSPNYGAPAAFINLSGNFGPTQGLGSVTVGGGVAEVTAWSNNAITIRVPSSAATGNVVVRGSGAISNPVPFTFYPFPSITNVSVSSGTPGTAVTITGANLLDGGGNATVRFNGTPATISSDTSGRIQVTVPTGATSGRLLVEVNGVTLIALSDFTVTP